jgi:hypothetical protein
MQRKKRSLRRRSYSPNATVMDKRTAGKRFFKRKSRCFCEELAGKVSFNLLFNSLLDRAKGSVYGSRGGQSSYGYGFF